MSQDDIIPWDEQPKPTGQLCYETFAMTLGWQFRGQVLPRWADLLPGEQQAFTEGAHTAIQKGWNDAQEGGTAKHRRQHGD